MTDLRSPTDDEKAFIEAWSGKITHVEIPKRLGVSRHLFRRWVRGGYVAVKYMPRGSAEGRRRGLEKIASGEFAEARRQWSARGSKNAKVARYEAALCETEIPAWIPPRDMNEFSSLCVTIGVQYALDIMSARHPRSHLKVAA